MKVIFNNILGCPANRINFMEDQNNFRHEGEFIFSDSWHCDGYIDFIEKYEHNKAYLD